MRQRKEISWHARWPERPNLRRLPSLLLEGCRQPSGHGERPQHRQERSERRGWSGSEPFASRARAALPLPASPWGLDETALALTLRSIFRQTMSRRRVWHRGYFGTLLIFGRDPVS